MITELASAIVYIPQHKVFIHFLNNSLWRNYALLNNLNLILSVTNEVKSKIKLLFKIEY